ncbi:hypothetical protein PVAND_017795, partial [Polypedilum vanderplanki]
LSVEDEKKFIKVFGQNFEGVFICREIILLMNHESIDLFKKYENDKDDDSWIYFVIKRLEDEYLKSYKQLFML